MIYTKNCNLKLKSRFAYFKEDKFKNYLLYQIKRKDDYIYSHSFKVAKYSVILGKKIGLGSEDLNLLFQGALLHDIGKIKIADQILNKAGRLSKVEYDKVKEHPARGVEFLRQREDLEGLEAMVLHHHEHYNGKGYPYGLSREKIPLKARILTITDSFDAMTTDRCYQKGKSIRAAREELKRCSGEQFDPELLDHFIEIIDNNRV